MWLFLMAMISFLSLSPVLEERMVSNGKSYGRFKVLDPEKLGSWKEEERWLPVKKGVGATVTLVRTQNSV